MSFADTYHRTVLTLLNLRQVEQPCELVNFLDRHRDLVAELSRRWEVREDTVSLPSPAEVVMLLANLA